MTPLLLLINVSKVVGVAGALTVAVNTLAFRHFRKRNLRPFPLTIDETQDVLASFCIEKDEDEGGFFFALATAPAHVEDKLDDAWLEFAKQEQETEELKSGLKEGVAQSVKSGTEEELVRTAEDEVEGATGEQIIAVEECKKNGAGSGESEKLQEQSKSASPYDQFSDWEVITDAAGKDVAGDKEQAKDTDRREDKVKNLCCGSLGEEPFFRYPDGNQDMTVKLSTVVRKGRGSVMEPMEEQSQFNMAYKVKHTAKVAMEAMLRGIEKFSVEEEKQNVAAWHNAKCPEERLRFWSDPDTELQLARGTNVTVFRMGVDWSRIVPEEPISGIQKVVNWQAVKRYRWILHRVHDHGMRVMLTLFHHSLPQWAAAYGGWKNEKTIYYFAEFARLAVEKFGDLVDYWVTFNEPHVFAMLTYCAGAWPGGDPNLLEVATSLTPRGIFKRAMACMANAHNQAYDVIHALSKVQEKKAKVGVSHHISFTRPYGLFDVPAVVLSNWMTRFAYVDDVADKLDFLGINYYGQEFISAPGLKLVQNDEFSESGRGVYPDGLYRLLMQFYARYKNHGFSYIITENGVSDESDYIRRPYIVEHLLAVRAAMDQGVPIQGYCFWTTSDNWEWADGYGPKFGLAAVDREHDLKRIVRPSYHLFAEIAKTGRVTKQQRQKAWNELMEVARTGKTRPFCRAVDNNGLMYAGGLDIPIPRQFVSRDWRFGHYQVDGLQDPLSCLLRSLANILLLGHGRKKQQQRKHSHAVSSERDQLLPTNAPNVSEKPALAGATA